MHTQAYDPWGVSTACFEIHLSGLSRGLQTGFVIDVDSSGSPHSQKSVTRRHAPRGKPSIL